MKSLFSESVSTGCWLEKRGKTRLMLLPSEEECGGWSGEGWGGWGGGGGRAEARSLSPWVATARDEVTGSQAVGERFVEITPSKPHSAEGRRALSHVRKEGKRGSRKDSDEREERLEPFFYSDSREPNQRRRTYGVPYSVAYDESCGHTVYVGRVGRVNNIHH
ncbi:hypothetical protein WN55_10618 [Dufourea novaeangliae]|uniref:Uncharacterized protein n=1 Tax=Dufourea novaeangliae TaxID=178035 RepID=A0A154P434_DUFNO|nr:hypothetical protein WN55_10618 [Dufourea novaeangliae]